MDRSVQPEAFMLMNYECEHGHREVIWNSRDGVTPFIVECVVCEKNGFSRDMQHVHWNLDRHAPDHVPKKGDRIFIDLTLEKAREYRKRFVDQWWDKDGLAMRDDGRYESKEDAIEKLARVDMKSFAPHTPDLVVVVEDVGG